MSQDMRSTLRDVSGGVVVPVGFDEPGESVAFDHAVRLAAAMRTSLTILHERKSNPNRYSIREPLERWGMLPAGSTPGDVAKLGFWASKQVARASNSRGAVLALLADRAADLLVLPVHGPAGVRRMLTLAAGEPTPKESETAVLYFGENAAGIIDGRNGSARLERILIPVAVKPSAASSARIAESIAKHLQAQAGTFRLLHVSEEGEARPSLEEPSRDGWTCEWVDREGEPADVISAEADAWHANLIVMTTQGRNGLFDALHGSTTERVLRRAPCPVLALPG